MDKYIRVARVYPAVLGTLPTCILLAMCMGEVVSSISSTGWQSTVGVVSYRRYCAG